MDDDYCYECTGYGDDWRYDKKKVTVSEWISVNERLPEECKEVLVTVKDDSADSPIYYTAVGWYYAGIWVVEDAVCHQVIAWMKPPKPYKEGAK